MHCGVIDASIITVRRLWNVSEDYLGIFKALTGVWVWGGGWVDATQVIIHLYFYIMLLYCCFYESNERQGLEEKRHLLPPDKNSPKSAWQARRCDAVEGQSRARHHGQHFGHGVEMLPHLFVYAHILRVVKRHRWAPFLSLYQCSRRNFSFLQIRMRRVPWQRLELRSFKALGSALKYMAHIYFLLTDTGSICDV